MSLPGNTSSTVAFGGRFMSPDDRVTTPIVDYELGGIALNDASQGLRVRPWKAYLDVYKVMLQAEGDAPIVLFEGTQITEISLCFDQNMRWSIGYIQAGVLKLSWFNSLLSDRVVTVFDTARNPKMAMDDKRPSMVLRSDMILAYIRENGLYYRQQRDRFLVEYELRTGLFPATKLKNIGMNKNLRMQFELV